MFQVEDENSINSFIPVQEPVEAWQKLKKVAAELITEKVSLLNTQAMSNHNRVKATF